MALTAKKVYAILKRQISDMEAKLNSPVRYRGTVATADLLPLNPDIGDMYNIESKSVYGEAGMNVAWNGVVWDTMGAPIDMSLYFTKEEAEAVIQRLVTEYFEKNPVKPGATTEQAQQIEQNKTDIVSLKTETDSLKEDMTSKADKTSLAQTDRKLDALWKLNQGISYEFQTDNTEAYQKTVPSGAKVANVKSIGGKTIVWNQLLGTGYENTKTANGITFTNNGDGSITIDGTAAKDALFQINSGHSFALYYGHTYLWNVGTTVGGVVVGNVNYTQFYKKKVAKWTFEKNKYYGHDCIKVVSGTTVSNLTIKPQLFNLTLMFGLGNEPSTVEEFEAMFPADYYPYNAGKLMSASVNEVVDQGKNLLDPETFEQNGVVYSIPQAVLKLDGYGDGIDDVCNYADWENKKYHKRIGRYVVTGDEQFYSQQTYVRDNSSDAYTSMDIGQKQSTDAKLISNKLLYSKWCWSEDLTYDAMCLNSTQIHIRILNSSLGITNEASAIEAQNAVKKYCKNLYESGDPIIIYYELAEEEIIDISDIVGDTFQEPLEVEAGGSLTFKNTNGDDYRIPVANTEEYLISLAEVNGND